MVPIMQYRIDPRLRASACAEAGGYMRLLG